MDPKRSAKRRFLDPRRLPVEVASSLVLCALFYWAYRNIDFGLLRQHVLSLVDRSLIYALVLNVFVFVFHGLRLKMLISGNFHTAFQIINLGTVLNVALPFRLGDLARIYLARQYYAVSAIRLLAAALVEKFCDLFGVAVLALIAFAFGARDYIGTRLVVILFAVTASIFLGTFVFFRSVWMRRATELMPERLHHHVIYFRDHLTVGKKVAIAASTVVIWAVNSAVVLVAFQALLPGRAFDAVDAISILVISALAVAVPGAPAGLGIFEAGVVAYLVQLHGIENELALACAVVFHVLIVAPAILFVLLDLGQRLVYRTGGLSRPQPGKHP